MTDVIERQAAIDVLKDMYYAAEKWGDDATDDAIKARAESRKASLVEMKLRLEALPSAQRTGRWIYNDEAYPGGNPYGHYECDQCGEYVPHKTNYCPNCGARMEEQE